jgi:DHA2 family multidrug resistance protein
MRRTRDRFDTPGLCLLAMTMVSWEVLLSKGQEWDWLGDPFYRVHAALAIFAVGLIALIRRELRIANPLVNFRTLKERNFCACCVIIFCAFGVLYANTTTLPGLLQSLFGYDATTSGLVLSPSGLGALAALVVIGALLGRGVDARLLIGAGLVTTAVGNYWMSQLNLSVSPWQVVWPRVVVIMGLSMMFAPINVAAFLYIPRELRPAAVGLLALLRNEGGSVGTSVAQTVLERREQFHALRLNEWLDPLNPAAHDFLAQGQRFFLQHTGDGPLSREMALGVVQHLRGQQALSLAYFDVFWVSAAIAIVLLLGLALMRRSVAEKGAHFAAE